MIFVKTNLKDAYIIELEKFKDQRGFFARTYCREEFNEHNIQFPIVQANISYSKKKGTLRGMHYQRKPHRESKLISCRQGAIYDVIIDIRPESPSYEQWTGIELNERNHRTLYVPEGFAHGFITLEDETKVAYPVSEFYKPDVEMGIRWDDPAFKIDWPAEVEVVSDKDKNWPDFNQT